LRVVDNVRATTSKYRRYYHVPITSVAPGASGATWMPATTNNLSGWRVENASEILENGEDIHSDWDGISDLKLEICFETNVDNSAGNPADTVDLKAVFYYKGTGDTSCKTQTVEVPTTVGQAAQYTQFCAYFTIDHDLASNEIEVGDVISLQLNLETDTSEVDNIIINKVSFSYLTTHVGIEDGDE